MCGRAGRRRGRGDICGQHPPCPWLCFRPCVYLVVRSLSSSPGGLAKALQAAFGASGAFTRLSIAEYDFAKEHRCQTAVFDRRALLQRTRRSPIRPRSRRVEASARKVSPEKPAGREAVDALRVFMAVSLQERRWQGKGYGERPVSDCRSGTILRPAN